MTDAQLASKLDVAPSLVSRYKGRGMPTHSVPAAREWMRRNVRKRVKSVAPGDGEVPDYEAARARREAAMADMAEMEAAKMRGELVLAEDVRRSTDNQFGRVREAILQLPARLGPVLEMRPLGVVVQTLDVELRAALTALAESD